MRESRFDLQTCSFLFRPSYLWSGSGHLNSFETEQVLLALILPLSLIARTLAQAPWRPAGAHRCAGGAEILSGHVYSCAVVSPARLILLPWIRVPKLPLGHRRIQHLFLAKNAFYSGRAGIRPSLWQHFAPHFFPGPLSVRCICLVRRASLAIGKLAAGNFLQACSSSTAFVFAALTWFLRAYVPPWLGAIAEDCLQRCDSAPPIIGITVIGAQLRQPWAGALMFGAYASESSSNGMPMHYCSPAGMICLRYASIRRLWFGRSSDRRPSACPLVRRRS